MSTMHWLIAIVITIALNATPVMAQNNLTLSGQAGGLMRLSAGTPSGSGGLTTSVVNSSTGATCSGSATDTDTFTFNVDFGDLSRGDGNPVIGSVGLRVRTNTSFRVVGSVVSFSANGMRYQGHEVTSADAGSFVRVWMGPLSTTGNDANNAGAIAINNALLSGMHLSEMSRGPASATSTFLCSGPAASLGGNTSSQSNAIEFPFYVSVPTGYELGPAPGSANGRFSFSMQFSILPY
jgi:hypothetical protein